MGYAKKLNILSNVIVKNSLKHYYAGERKIGYQFELRLDYYRGHFLSVIDEFEVKMDGQSVPSERIKFCINSKEFSPVEFDKCYSEFWQAIEPATVRVICPEGLSNDDFHQIDVTLIFRSPYMPIGPDHQYMAIDNCGSRMMKITD